MGCGSTVTRSKAESDRSRTSSRPAGLTLDVVTEVAGVPQAILTPRDTWADGEACAETVRKLAGLFRANFERYEDRCEPEVRQAGPTA